jgi:lipid-A-disaccharide synthase
VILIDYPGFNFRIAEFAHKEGFKVFYYIAPKIWAWKEKRGERLKKFVDRLFIIFPFEIEYFKRRWQIDAIYRGNPLLDSIDRYRYIHESSYEFAQRLNNTQELSQKVEAKMFEDGIALLAGSRKGEISFLLPRMIDLMLLYPTHTFFLAAAPSIDSSLYSSIIENHISRIKLNSSQRESIKQRLIVIHGQTYSILKHCKAAIVNSGTASLEAALIGIPQVVCYGASELTYIIAKHLVKGIRYISLANLILDKLIFKELIQHDCTSEKISQELNRLLTDTKYIEQMKEDYGKVREVLGGGGASQAVAKAIIEELKKM